MATPIPLDDLPVVHAETVRRRRTWRLFVEWEGIDLSGCTAALELRAATSDRALLVPAPAVTISVDTSGDDPVSTLDATVTPADTGDIPATITRGTYELVVTYPGGAKYTFVEGALTIADGAVQ